MHTNFLLTLRGAGPLHARLYRALKAAVLDGRLQPGTRVPATRAVAREQGVSRMTVVQAYERLIAEGYLEGRVGAGTFVPGGLRLAAGSDNGWIGEARQSRLRLSAWGTRIQAAAHALPGEAMLRFDFRYGRPDTGALPLAVWRRIVSRHAADPPTAYADPRGSPRLRAVLASYLGRSRGVRTDASHVVVCTGSQQALDLTARTLLDAGDGAVLEEPNYQGARRVLEAAGARMHYVATDEQGLVPEALPEDDSIRLAVVTPSHQFPSGGVLSLDRRLRLLSWARAHNAVVIEDDYDGEFRYDADPIEAIHALDTEDRVLYVGTLSKVLFPGLRLGYLVVPPNLVDVFLGAKWLADRHSPLLEQEALATFIEEGHFERHLRRCRARYARRRETLLDALRRHLGGRRRVRVQGAAAGLHVVLWFPGLSADATPALIDAARRRGVGVYPVSPYFHTPPSSAGLVIGYSALEEQDIEAGIRLLGAVV